MQMIINKKMLLALSRASFAHSGRLLPIAAWVVTAMLSGCTSEKKLTAADSRPLTTELYTTLPGKLPYRIPAITQTPSGRLLVVSDYRPCGSDIGFGRVDLYVRHSEDGLIWSRQRPIAEGTGVAGAVDCGFGDGAIVSDRETGEVLLLSVCGNTVYWAQTTTRQNPNRVARFVSRDGGETWSRPEDISESVYSLFDACSKGPVESLFVGSGKIFQSSLLKAGKNYRIYAALCARPNGNRVIYSDDLGQTWHALGSVDEFPAPKGDEPKCVELPDGNVLLSSRARGGRIFNIFTYTDAKKGQGRWQTPAYSSADTKGVVAVENSCNGGAQLVAVKRLSDGQKLHLLLQSVPFGPERQSVGIYYKELENEQDYATPEAIARDWDGNYPVSTLPSAYSELYQLRDGRIAIVYEESTQGADYSIQYSALSIEQITGGKYRLR